MKTSLNRTKPDTARRDIALRRLLIGKMAFPRIKPVQTKPHHPGRPCTIDAQKLFTPILRLERQKYEKTPLGRNDRIFVSINTSAGPALCPCRYSPKNKAITFDLPKNARSGPAVLFLPAREYSNSKARIAARCPGSATKAGDAFDRMTGQAVSDFTFPAGVFYLQVACGLCRTRSLCPNGAIKFDDRGYCYVDQAVCQGQRRHNYAGGLEERTCWSCFSPGALGSVSELCPQGILAKTLSMDPHCCGCCPPARRVVPGMTLKSLCAQGAIGGGLRTSYEADEHGQGVFDYNCPEQVPPGPYEPVHYIVDQDQCTGCMTCYLNIACAQPRMKARIRRPAALFTLEDVVLEPLNPPVPGKYRGGLYLGVWGERDGKPYFKEVKLKLDRRRRFELNLKLAASPEASFMIYGKGGRGFNIPLGRDIRPAMQTVSFGNLIGGSSKVRIKTEMGTFILALMT